MVLESLLDPKRALHKPYVILFIGMLYSSVAILLSLWIFKGQGSIIMVTLTMVACTHFMYLLIKQEEEKDKRIKKEKVLLREHGKAAMLFVLLFFGFIISFSFWYTILPYEVSQQLFEVQIATINAINDPLTGKAISGIADVHSIFFSNSKVLLFAILFSFVYGLGAIFLLTWNASVIGTAMGSFIRSNLGVYANNLGWYSISNYLHTFSLGILKYATHGIPEVASYFVAGLAGGIISVAVIKHDFMSKKYKIILRDAVDLVILAVALLYAAALIEVYVTPSLF